MNNPPKSSTYRLNLILGNEWKVTLFQQPHKSTRNKVIQKQDGEGKNNGNHAQGIILQEECPQINNTGIEGVHFSQFVLWIIQTHILVNCNISVHNFSKLNKSIMRGLKYVFHGVERVRCSQGLSAPNGSLLVWKMTMNKTLNFFHLNFMVWTAFLGFSLSVLFGLRKGKPDWCRKGGQFGTIEEEEGPL